MGCIAVHWKEVNPKKSSFLTSTRTLKFLATTLWLLDLTDAAKMSVTHKVGHTRNVHFFVLPKRRIHNGIDC